MHQKSVLFVTIGIFLDKGLKIQPDISNGCHDVLMMSMNLKDTSILNIHGVDYCFIINGLSKSKAVNSLQNADLIEKRETL